MDHNKINHASGLPLHKVLECINLVNNVVNRHVNSLYPVDQAVKAQFSNEILSNNRGTLLEDMDRLYTNLLNKSKSKRGLNDNYMELHLNYLHCLKEYYKCYIAHYNDLYEMCVRKDPERAATLANLYKYLRKLILLHINASLNSIPYKLNHSPLLVRIHDQLFSNGLTLNSATKTDEEFVYSDFMNFLKRDLPEFAPGQNNLNFQKMATILDPGSHR